jgi:hypothetical protein
MAQRSHGVLGPLILGRAQIVEVAIGAIVLGLGTGLIGSYLADRLPPRLIALIGVTLVVAALGILLSRAFQPGTRERRFEGFALYDGAENGLVPADRRYDFGTELQRCLKSGFAEDQDLRDAWDTQPLSAHLTSDTWSEAESAASREVIRQAAEYFVLTQLSTHLSDYFDDLGASRELMRLHPSDMSDVVTDNRFLKLFTTPIEERAATSEAAGTGPMVTVHRRENGEGPDQAVLVLQHGPGDVRYERFLLILPAGSKIRRQAADQIEIDTRRFRLAIQSTVDGKSRSLPPGYAANYLQAIPLEQEHRLVSYVVRVTVTVRPRIVALLSPMNWSLYIWLDNWLDTLDQRLSRERYLERIGWEAAETVRHLISPRVRTSWTQSEQQPNDT